MGIDGLLQFFKPATYSGHISVFRKQNAAIDAMGWLYRGAYSCALELATQEPTDHYLLFTYNMINVLKLWEIKPVFCIDGRDLKAKEKTMNSRNANKEKEKAKANKILESGNEFEARKAFTRCLDVTKEMVYRLVDMLNALEIEFIIAPFEADAQIAYLCRKGYTNFGISEDSDQLCYNSPLTVFKLGTFGECEYVDLKDLRNRRKAHERLGDESVDTMMDLSEIDFIYICVLSGSDYMPSIKGMGIKKAINYFSRFGALENVIKRMKIDQQFQGKVPEGYDKMVKKVSNSFRYQLVYDPTTKSFTTLNPSENMNELLENSSSFVGNLFPNAEKFAKGRLDIETLKDRALRSIDVKEILGLKKSRKNNKDLVKKSQSMISFSDFQKKTVVIVENDDEKDEDFFQLNQNENQVDFEDLEEIKEEKEEIEDFEEKDQPEMTIPKEEEENNDDTLYQEMDSLIKLQDEEDIEREMEMKQPINILQFESIEKEETPVKNFEVKNSSTTTVKTTKKRKDPSFIQNNESQSIEEEIREAYEIQKKDFFKKHRTNSNTLDPMEPKISIFLKK